MGQKVLVIEDEQTILDSLTFSLAKEGYIVATTTDGRLALECFEREKPDAVLLDLTLGPVDGLDVLRELRRVSPVPVIILTARDDETDKVCGLEMGADDYVTKPFSMRELIARLRAQLRKQNSLSDSRQARVQGIFIDFDRAETFRGDVRIFLTAREFELLRVLFKHKDRVLSRDWLLEHVWGDEYDGDDRVVDTTVKRLRHKLAAELIETVRGLGYRLSR